MMKIIILLATMSCSLLANDDLVVTIKNSGSVPITLEIPGLEMKRRDLSADPNTAEARARRDDSSEIGPKANKLAIMQHRLYPGAELRLGSLPKKITAIETKSYKRRPGTKPTPEKRSSYSTTAPFDKLPEPHENIEITYNNGSFSMRSTDEQRPPE